VFTKVIHYVFNCIVFVESSFNANASLSLMTSLFESSLLNHVVHSRILHHFVYLFTVTGPGASVETIQSCTELGAKTGGK